ncbi:kinase-like domain-containing protein [Xylariaceae sp. FL1272]|nr:kinase-like domain-containing protein [Xylariaceae sp. FL1272]
MENLNLSVVYAPAESVLPAPLPTVNEIYAAAADPDQNMSGPRYDRRRVVKVGEHFVVKFGPKVSFQEGYVMDFVRRHTSIPIPTLYAMARSPITEDIFIVMENIEGQPLEHFWDLDDTEKLAIEIQLRAYMDELCRIPAPNPPYYGSVNQKPYTSRDLQGPYETENDFIDAYLLGTAAYFGMTDTQMEKDMRLKQEFKSIAQLPPVFGHGELADRNIIRRDNGSLCIIDWEYGGWYPQWHEYLEVVREVRGSLPDFLEEFPERKKTPGRDYEQ